VQVNASISAVVFDVDGTLYDHRSVRRKMAARLATAYLLNPVTGFQLLRFLQAYRRAQESLRGSNLRDNIGEHQLILACKSAAIEPAAGRAYLERWFRNEPLPYIQAAVRDGIHSLLAGLQSAGIKLGVLSDYPAESKLEAARLRPFFSAVVCSSDPGVTGFKPDPSGLRLCAARLGVEPRQLLYVGDREEVDAECAHRAGASAVIVGKRLRRPPPRPGTSFAESFSEIHQALAAAGVVRFEP
jgi:putative hydrolase of the HAD superfamily